VMRIIDAHAHYGEWFFPIRATKEHDIMRIAAKYKIEKVIFSSTLAIVYDLVEGNRALGFLIDMNPDYYGYVVLNPNYPELSEKMILECLSNPKFLGMKIHPDYSAQPVSCETNIHLLDLARKKRRVVLLHTWGEQGVRASSAVAETFPDLFVIMGHMGGDGLNGQGWRAAIGAARKLDNVYLEICGSDLHKDRIKEAVDAMGCDRILFGSDMTLIAPDFAVGMVTEAEISEEAKEAIFYTNAKKLFGI